LGGGVLSSTRTIIFLRITNALPLLRVGDIRPQ
jgi:hypothetical protein